MKDSITSPSKRLHTIADKMRFFRIEQDITILLDEFFTLSVLDQRKCLAYLLGRIEVMNEVRAS